VRVWSNNAPGLINVAFINPDQSRVLVVYNDSSSTQAFQVVSYGASFSYTLPPLGGATFQWSAGREHACFAAPRQPALIAGRPARPECWTPTIPATAQIQASSYSEVSTAVPAVNASGLQTEPCSDTGGGFDLGYSSPGYWAEYRSIDFGSGVQSVQVRVANGSGGTGTVEFHSGSPTGPLFAQASIPNTGGWQTWTTVTAPVSGASGVQNLFIVFQNGNSSGLGNVNWFQFQ
jgi:glucosylceramidase